MLNVINEKKVDWPATWLNSPECKGVYDELARIKNEMGSQPASDQDDASTHTEFAMPLSSQIYYVTQRVFAQYWRMPEYIYSKFILGVVSALFISFSFFHADSSQQGLQNVIFSIFMLTAIVSSMVQQIMPRFITQVRLLPIPVRSGEHDCISSLRLRFRYGK